MKNKINNSIWSIEHSNNLVKEHSKQTENLKEIKIVSDRADYFNEYSSVIKDVVNDLIKEGYTFFFKNHIDNIFIFYKIKKGKIFFTSLEGDSVYIKNPNPFTIRNHSFNIKNINISESYSNCKIIVQYKNKNIEISCFNSYTYDSRARELTEKETETLRKEKQMLFQKIYFLNKEIIKNQKEIKFSL